MIRKATVKDIDSILTITKACAEHMESRGIFQWNDTYPNTAAFENDLKRQELFVIENRDGLLGCIALSSKMDVEYKTITWLTENKNNLYVHRLAIHPKHQKQGYAQKLMDFAESYSIKNNYTSIRLDTFSQNHRNQKFYELRGYKKLDAVYFPNQSEYPFYCYELIL